MISQPPMRDVLSSVCVASEQKACLRGQCGPKQEIIITADGRSVLFLPSYFHSLRGLVRKKGAGLCVVVACNLEIMILWRERFHYSTTVLEELQKV